MSDLKLTWNGWGADATVEGHDLVFEDGMATAVILSLFLDARARADDDRLGPFKRPLQAADPLRAAAGRCVRRGP